MQKSKNKNIFLAILRPDLKAPQGRALTACIVSIAIILFIPQVSLAFTLMSLASFFIFIIVNPLVYIIIGLAVVYFLWGVTKYILHSGDAKAREEGRSMMIYGIIAIFVMVSVWGLVNLLKTTFQLDGETNNTLPNVGDFLP